MSKKFNHAIIRIKNADGDYDALSALRGQNSYELAVKAGFTGTEEEWMESIIGDGWIGAFQEVDERVTILEGSTLIKKTNVAVDTSAFVSDTTYDEYPYRASIAITDVTSSMVPDVMFDQTEISSGLFSSVSTSYDGGIYIYASAVPDEMITIPTIIIWR